MEKGWKPNLDISPNCPRCGCSNTKFCYYNNYSLTQPRYFCKGCRRYWTKGGSLRNVPVGGGCRKNRRAKSTLRLSAAADGVQNLLAADFHRHSTITSSSADGSHIDLALVYANFLNPKSDSDNISSSIIGSEIPESHCHHHHHHHHFDSLSLEQLIPSNMAHDGIIEGIVIAPNLSAQNDCGYFCGLDSSDHKQQQHQDGLLIEKFCEENNQDGNMVDHFGILPPLPGELEIPPSTTPHHHHHQEMSWTPPSSSDLMIDGPDHHHRDTMMIQSATQVLPLVDVPDQAQHHSELNGGWTPFGLPISEILSPRHPHKRI